MGGMIFYLVSWCLWVITTFFLNRRNPDRLGLTVGLLLLIIVSPYRITLMGLTIHFSAFVLFFFLYREISRYGKGTRNYFFLTGFIIMLGYASFQMLALFDPVWLIFRREWLLACALVYLAILLQANAKLRLAALLAGAVQGEILYAFVLGRLSLDYPAVSIEFLDTMGISVSIILVWHGLETSILQLRKLVKPLEREKYKST